MTSQLEATSEGFCDHSTGECIDLPDGYSHLRYAAERFLKAREQAEESEGDRKRWQAYLVGALGDEVLEVGAIKLRAVTRRISRFDPFDFWQLLPAEMTRDEMLEIIKAGKSYDAKALPSVAQEAHRRAQRQGESSAWVEIKA